jgi:hypothetical protein
MYKLICIDREFEFKSYDNLKLAEGVERAMRNDYTIHFPDGEILECKFKSSAKNPNTEK